MRWLISFASFESTFLPFPFLADVAGAPAEAVAAGAAEGDGLAASTPCPLVPSWGVAARVPLDDAVDMSTSRVKRGSSLASSGSRRPLACSVDARRLLEQGCAESTSTHALEASDHPIQGSLYHSCFVRCPSKLWSRKFGNYAMYSAVA